MLTRPACQKQKRVGSKISPRHRYSIHLQPFSLSSSGLAFRYVHGIAWATFTAANLDETRNPHSSRAAQRRQRSISSSVPGDARPSYPRLTVAQAVGRQNDHRQPAGGPNPRSARSPRASHAFASGPQASGSSRVATRGSWKPLGNRPLAALLQSLAAITLCSSGWGHRLPISVSHNRGLSSHIRCLNDSHACTTLREWSRFLCSHRGRRLERCFDISIDTMTTSSSIRGGAVLFLIAGLVLTLSDRGRSQTALPTARSNVGEWRATDLSLLDFIADGYDLVSVIAPSFYTRIYFLAKPGAIVKCRGETTTRGPPPFLPPLPQTPGQAGMQSPTSSAPGQIGTVVPPSPATPGQANASGSSPSDSIVADVPAEFECAELSRVSRK